MSSTARPLRHVDRTLLAAALLYLTALFALGFSDSVLPAPQRLLAALPLWLFLPFALVRPRPGLLLALAASIPALLYALGLTYHQHAPGNLRVATLSVFHGARGPERIAEALRTLDADIVCFQDASPTVRLPDPVPPIQNALPGYTFVRDGPLVIASRHPITRYETLTLPTNRFRAIALTAEIALPTGPVQVATTRRGKGMLVTQGTDIDARLEAVAAWVERQSGPTIVCGDFLTPLDAAERRRLTADLADAFATAGTGFGWTYPDRFPLVRVDYVLAGRGLTPVACRTLAPGLSDHRAVVADLTRS